MKILVTGSSGFIGTNLMQSFIERQIDVLGIDINVPKIASHSSYFKKVDITNHSDLSSIVLKFSPNYIIHLAARTDLDGLKLEDYLANTIGVKNLLEVAKNLPNLKKYL